MTTVTEKTIREIAIENPSSIRVFETLGIDYCCGGRKSLSDACAHTGHEMSRVLDLLAEAERGSQARDAQDWTGEPLAALIAHIVEKHHGFVRRESARLEPLLAKVAGKHGPLHPEVASIGQLFLAMSQELSTHMMKEERILFPYIEQMEQAAAAGARRPQSCFGSVEQPIANMVAEHEDAGELLSRIRHLSGGFAPPAGACPTFVAVYKGLEDFERDLHRHVHLENNILFPRAIAMEAR